MALPSIEITDREGLIRAVDNVGPAIWLVLIIRIDPIPLWIIGLRLFTRCADELRASVTVDGMPALPSLGPVYTVGAIFNVLAYVWFLAPNPHPILFYSIYPWVFTHLGAIGLTLRRLRQICLFLGARDAARLWWHLQLYIFGISLFLVAHLVYNIVTGANAALIQNSTGRLHIAIGIPLALLAVWVTLTLLRAAWSAPDLTRDAIDGRIPPDLG